MNGHNKNIKSFALLFTFRYRIQIVIDMFGKLSKVFLYFFLISTPFYSFTTGLDVERSKAILRGEVVPIVGRCQLQFQEYTPLPSINTNNLTAIRDRLQTNQGIGGSVTLNIAPPFSPEMSEKLRQFTVSRQGAGSLASSNHLKPLLLQSKLFSPKEVDIIMQGLNRYVEQIKQLIFQLDGREIELDLAVISTEQAKAVIHHHNFEDSRSREWISATHALIGTGTWYETIYENKRQITVAKTGETLLLSDPYRMASFSGISEKILDEYILSTRHDIPHSLRPFSREYKPIKGAFHGSSPGKRLMILAFFSLQGNIMDSRK